MIQRTKFAANTIFLSVTQDPMAKLLRIRSLPSINQRVSGPTKPAPHAPDRTRGLLDSPRHRRRPASSRTRAPQCQPRYAARRRPAVALAPHARASPAAPQLPQDAPLPLSPQDATGAVAAGAGRRQAALLLGSGGCRCVKAPSRSAALLLRPQDAARAAGSAAAGAGRC
jgi:hypothetical protein